MSASGAQFRGVSSGGGGLVVVGGFGDEVAGDEECGEPCDDEDGGEAEEGDVDAVRGEFRCVVDGDAREEEDRKKGCDGGDGPADAHHEGGDEGGVAGLEPLGEAGGDGEGCEEADGADAGAEVDGEEGEVVGGVSGVGGVADDGDEGGGDGADEGHPDEWSAFVAAWDVASGEEDADAHAEGEGGDDVAVEDAGLRCDLPFGKGDSEGSGVGEDFGFGPDIDDHGLERDLDGEAHGVLRRQQRDDAPASVGLGAREGGAELVARGTHVGVSAEFGVEDDRDEQGGGCEPDETGHAVRCVESGSEFRAEDGAEHARADEEADGLCASVAEERCADLSGLCRGDGVVHTRADDADGLEHDELPEVLGEADGSDGECADEESEGCADARVVAVGEPREERLERAGADGADHQHRGDLPLVESEAFAQRPEERGEEDGEDVDVGVGDGEKRELRAADGLGGDNGDELGGGRRGRGVLDGGGDLGGGGFVHADRARGILVLRRQIGGWAVLGLGHGGWCSRAGRDGRRGAG